MENLKCGHGRFAQHCDRCADAEGFLLQLSAANATIAELRREVEKHRGWATELTGDVAELRKDAERLDWMEHNEDDWPIENLNGEWIFLDDPRGALYATFRAALDAAIAKQPK